MRRSARQCVTSFNHSWWVLSVHGVYPPTQAPRMVRHSGDGICCPLGAYFVSCATAATKAIANAAARPTSLVFNGFSLGEEFSRNLVWCPDLRHPFGASRALATRGIRCVFPFSRRL